MYVIPFLSTQSNPQSDCLCVLYRPSGASYGKGTYIQKAGRASRRHMPYVICFDNVLWVFVSVAHKNIVTYYELLHISERTLEGLGNCMRWKSH